LAKALDIEAATRLDNWYDESKDATQVLIANAIMNLNDDNPYNKMVYDHFAFGDGSDLFGPSTPVEDYDPSDPLGYAPDNPELDINNSDINETVTQKNKLTSLYDDYTSPGYLDMVKGKKIQMPDGSIRIYSENGYSYRTQGEPWMGMYEGTNIVTTHNKLSGQPLPKPSSQYSGMSLWDSLPFLAAPISGTASLAIGAIQAGLDYTGYGPESHFTPEGAIPAAQNAVNPLMETINQTNSSSGQYPTTFNNNQPQQPTNVSKTNISVGGLSPQNKGGYYYNIPGEPRSTDINVSKIDKPVGNWYRGNQLIPENDPFFYDGYRGRLSPEWSFKLDAAGINTDVFKSEYEAHLSNNKNPKGPNEFAKGMIK